MTSQARETILRATTSVTLLIFLGKAGGLLREVLMVRSFEVRDGVLSATDAFISALWLNLALYNAWQHAMPHAYIPPLHRTNDPDAQRRLLWRTLGGGALILTVYLALLLLNIPWIAVVMAGGSGSAPQQVALTRHLLMWTAVVGPLMCLATIIKTHANGMGRYTWPAAAMLPFSFGGALGLWLFADRLGIDALALGTVAGAAGYLVLVAWPLLRRPGAAPKLNNAQPSTSTPNTPQPKIWRSFAAYFGSGLLLEFDFLLLLIVSRHLSPGFPTLLYLSMQLANIFSAPIDRGFSTSVFSQFSHHVNCGAEGLSKARFLLVRGLTILLLIGTALSAVSWWVAEPMAGVLFQRGAFDSTDVRFMSSFVPLFFLSIFPTLGAQLIERLAAVLARARDVLRIRATYQIHLALMGAVILFALEDYATPTMRMQLLLGAYALANVLRYLSGWKLVRAGGYRFEAAERREVAKTVSAVLLASVVMPVGVTGWRFLSSRFWGDANPPHELNLIVLASWYLIALASSALLLRLQTARIMISWIRRVLSRS